MFSDNTSNASEFFKSKEEYENAFPSFLENNFYDLWYERPYYGKIDTKGAAVYPRESIVENLDPQER